MKGLEESVRKRELMFWNTVCEKDEFAARAKACCAGANTGAFKRFATQQFYRYILLYVCFLFSKDRFHIEFVVESAVAFERIGFFFLICFWVLAIFTLFFLQEVLINEIRCSKNKQQLRFSHFCIPFFRLFLFALIHFITRMIHFCLS